MTERIFLSWDEHALPQAARHLAEVHATDDELPLGGLLVVLPGRRAGRRLAELLIDEAERRDLVLTPPRSTTIGEVPELFYEPSAPLADSGLSRLVWARTLRSLDSDRRSVVFPDPPDEEDLHGWVTLASVVDRLHRDTAREGLDFTDVARACRKGGGFDDSGRWQVLSEAQGRYQRRLESLGYIDHLRARRSVLEEDELTTGRHVYLLGVAEMPGIVGKMLRGLDAPLTALVHAPPERADAFDALGCVRTGAWREEEIRISEKAIAEAGRPPSQADEVVRRLSNGGRELGPDEVTVGVPNKEVVPFLEQRFRAYGVPHRYAVGTALPQTGPYRLLEAVADYLETTRFSDFAALVRHPEVSRGMEVPGALQAVDEHFGEHLTARIPLSDPESDGEARRFEQVRRYLERGLELGRLSGRRPLSEWMLEVLALLQRSYGGRRLDRSKPGERRTIEALEQLRNAAAALHRLPEQVDESCSSGTAVRVLLSEVREQVLPPLPDRSAVEMLGWLELHLDDAPVLVITGFDDAHVPASINADLFLPNGLRSRLGLLDNERRYARDAYLLSATLASREETHIVVGRRNAEGDPLRPSRLLMATSGRELAERARRLFSENRRTPPPLPRLGVEPAERSGFRNPPEPEIELEAPPDSLQVTDFGLLLQDPYRWVLENQLGLEEVADRARELDPLQFGGLGHAVLHRFGESAEVGSPDPGAVRARLDEILEAEAGNRYEGAVPAVRLQVEQLRARLADFANWHASRVHDGWKTVAVEVGTPEGGLPLEVDGEPIGIRGRIDRVDHHPEPDRWEVLDYKTSAKARDPDGAHRDGGEWVDLQLPLYHHLLPGLVDEAGLPDGIVAPEADVALGYISLSRNGTDHGLAAWDRQELESALAVTRDLIRKLRSGAIVYRDDRDAPGGDAFESLFGEGHLDPGGPDGNGPAGGDGR